MSHISLPQRRVNALTASSATLQDYFPRTFAFDIGLEGRPYAVAGRRTRDGQAAEPDLIVISAHGVLHHFRATDGSATGWSEERYDLPDLKGATILRINASAQDPETGRERLIVTVSAQRADRHRVFLILERTPAGWRHFDMPPSPFDEKDLSFAVDSGFVGVAGGKLQTFYACLPPGFGTSLAAYGVTNAGEAFTLALRDSPQGIDRLVAPVNDWRLSLMRLEGNTLRLFPSNIDPRDLDLRSQILPVHFEPAPSMTFQLPADVAARDASCMTPITDTRGLCNGVFVRTADKRLIACAFEDDRRSASAAVVTGGPDAPATCADVTSSLTPDGTVHVYVRDEEDLIWFASWGVDEPATALTWERTGWTGRDIQAPQLAGERASVFADDGKDRIDMLTREGAHSEWARSSVTIPEPSPDADPAQVHVVTVNAVTAQSNAVPGTAVDVRATTPMVAEYQGDLYRLGPDRSVTFQTGPTGGVTFRVKAAGIDTAALLVSTPQLPNVGEMTFKPQEAALRRLANLDPAFPVTGDRLKQAGVAPADMSTADADALADVLSKAARQALGAGAEAPGNHQLRRMLANAPPVAPVSVRFTRAADGRVSVARSVPQAGSLTRALAAADASAESAGGFWSFLRTMWDKVTDFVIEVVEEGVNFIIETAKGIKKLFTDAARYISEGIQAVLAWLGKLSSDLVDAGKKLAAWVAEALGWDDVLRCKNLIRDYTLTSLIEVETLVGKSLPNKISEGIAWAKDQVESAFDKAIGQLDSQHQIPKNKVEADPTAGRIQARGSEVLAVQNAVPENAGEFQLFEFSPELEEKVRTVALRAEEIGKGDQWRALFQPMVDMFKGKTSLADGLAIGAAGLLRVLKPVVLFALDLVDVVQTLVLELVAKVIGLFRRALATPITAISSAFNWVNALYRGISGGADLSIIDLVSLFLAAPAAILHHIVKGKPVIEPETHIPDKLTTPLALLPAMMDSTVTAQDRGDIEKAVAATYKVMSLIYDIVVMVWTFLRVVVSLVENTLRLTDLENVSTAGTARTWFSRIVMIADYGPMVWFGIAEVLGKMGSKMIELMVQNPQATELVATVLAFLVVLVLSTKLLSSIFKYITDKLALIPPALMVFLLSAISAITGALLLLLNGLQIVAWLKWDSPEKTDAENARFWAARASSITLQARKVAAVVLPIGWALSKAEPISGSITIAAAFAIDEVCYLTSGCIQAYRLSVA